MRALRVFFSLALLSAARADRLCGTTLNPRVLEAEYAVRGRLLDKALSLEAQGRPVVKCNIGNPQALGQRPLSWVRQVLALLIDPQLLEAAEEAHARADERGAPLRQLFEPDAVARARKYLEGIRSVGAYSDSQGARIVREEVAAFLTERDGCEAHASDIYLTDGASAGVRNLMQVMLGRPGVDAILAPSPVYPLYSALSTLMDGASALYPLTEDPTTGEWKVCVEELQRSIDEARARGACPRGLVIINPGNPTGQCMSLQEVTDILAFAAREGLVLMADEVYQSNVYNTPGASKTNEFHSFRRALDTMRKTDPELAAQVQLVSMHSTSKGFYGECGLRGGFMALDGDWDDVVRSQLVKIASISLCSNVVGQMAMGCIVNPPREGDASYPKYVEERDAILTSLKARADTLANALDALPGVTCAPVEGALYLFPRIALPPKAIATAQAAGVAPDEFYAMQLLEATGLVVVPGSGFGQPDPTGFHVRTTFLPPMDQLEAVMAAFAKFHYEFLAKFADEAHVPA